MHHCKLGYNQFQDLEQVVLLTYAYKREVDCKIAVLAVNTAYTVVHAIPSRLLLF